MTDINNTLWGGQEIPYESPDTKVVTIAIHNTFLFTSTNIPNLTEDEGEIIFG